MGFVSTVVLSLFDREISDPNSRAFQAPVVQRVDNTIQWIIHYPADKYWPKQITLSAG